MNTEMIRAKSALKNELQKGNNNKQPEQLNEFDLEIESWESIALTQTQLDKIKNDLNLMIDAMANNPSLISRAADFWGHLSVWKKIIAGIALILPTLLVGILAQIAIFLVISIFTLIAFSASSFVLSDHLKHNTATTDGLKDGISNLAEVLGTVIRTLDLLRQKLARSIEEFEKENEILQASITELNDEILNLTTQTQQLQDTEQQLAQTNEKLKQTCTQFTQTIDEQAELIKANQRQIEQTHQAYEASQIQLSEKIIEFNTVKVEMGLENEKTKKIAMTLQAAVEALSGTVITDGENQIAFKDKLDQFLTNKEASFDQVAIRLSEAERELFIVKEELKQSNERYKELLDRGSKQITRLESLHEGRSNHEHTRTTTLLEVNGLFAKETLPRHDHSNCGQAYSQAGQNNH